MLQLLTLLCMEPPIAFTADDVRNEKVKVLSAIRPPRPEEVAKMAVRAQYAAGVSAGEDAVGYLEEDGVPDDSTTETYVALRLEVANWRWAGVPIYLRTGKRLARKVTEIAVTLRPVPHLAFETEGSVGVQPNQLVLTVQPNEGVSLSLGAKIPGATMRIRPVMMEFLYGTSFMSESPEAYERLILDAMRGEATLFTRNDEVDALWSIVRPDPGGVGAITLERCRSTRPGRRGRRRPTSCCATAITGGRCRRAAVNENVTDDVWSAQDTSPDEIEAALRELLRQRHAEDATYVPARVLNLVCHRRPRLARRDREPPASRSVATTRRARSSARWTRVARRSTPG